MVQVKICGLTRAADMQAAVDAGAHYIGFVFFEKSPRNVSMQTATDLCALIPPGVVKVGLVVDPDTAFLDELMEAVPLDMIQLHGHESPMRVGEVKRQTRLPVMKAVPIATQDDVAQLADYEAAADQILCDAKPDETATRPGGNGTRFDWSLLTGHTWTKPWMLAGGLDPTTVTEAIRVTGAQQVDVSSGVEYKPGLKNPDTIKAFIQATQV